MIMRFFFFVLFAVILAGAWSANVFFHKVVETNTREVTVITASVTSTERNRKDPGPLTTASPAVLKLDPSSPPMEVNLKYFECRAVVNGYFCFSSDFNFCVHGDGAIPTRKVIVQRLAVHPFEFCRGKAVMEALPVLQSS